MKLAAVGQKDITKAPGSAITIRTPKREDGAGVWKLISDTASLDDNSMYCNLLQCSHFSATCAIAEMDGEVVGWVSGYIPPESADTYFVWQVCVSDAARGQGLGRRLIGDVLARPACRSVTTVQCTITHDNEPAHGQIGGKARVTAEWEEGECALEFSRTSAMTTDLLQRAVRQVNDREPVFLAIEDQYPAITQFADTREIRELRLWSCIRRPQPDYLLRTEHRRR